MARAHAAQNDVSLIPDIVRLLREPRAASTLSDDDLLIFAACLEQRRVLEPLRMASLLRKHGLANGAPEALAARLHSAASKVRGLVRFGALVGVDDWRVIQRRALTTLRRRETLRPSEQRSTAATAPPTGKSQTVAASSRAPAARDPFGESPSTAAFDVPPAPPLGATPVTWIAVDTQALAAALAEPSADPYAVSITTRAHQLPPPKSSKSFSRPPR